MAELITARIRRNAQELRLHAIGENPRVRRFFQASAFPPLNQLARPLSGSGSFFIERPGLYATIGSDVRSLSVLGAGGIQRSVAAYE